MMMMMILRKCGTAMGCVCGRRAPPEIGTETGKPSPQRPQYKCAKALGECLEERQNSEGHSAAAPAGGVSAGPAQAEQSVCSPCDDSVRARPNESEDVALPCSICRMLLNGAHQYQDHLKSKLHRKNMKKSQGGRPHAVARGSNKKARGSTGY